MQERQRKDVLNLWSLLGKAPFCMAGRILGIQDRTKLKLSCVFASKQIGLEVNAVKTKYMVMSRNQNARQSTT
jgi:hypothetical protein